MRGFKINYIDMTRGVKINCRNLTSKTAVDKPVKVRGSIKFPSDFGRILGFSGDKLAKSNTIMISPYPAMPRLYFISLLVHGQYARHLGFTALSAFTALRELEAYENTLKKWDKMYAIWYKSTGS